MSQSDDLPVADLAPSPLPYARGISTGDMKWVVRFVALFMLAGLLANAMQTLVYNGVALLGPITWKRILEASVSVVVPLLAVGVLRLNFYALGALVVFLAARPALILFYSGQFPLRFVVPVSLVAVGQAILLLLICLRARRAGVLVPPSRHEPVAPPAGDDVHWLVRIAGWFLLLPVFNIVMWLGEGWTEAYARDPASAVLVIVTTALRVGLSLALIRGRVKALLWMAGLFAVSLIVHALQRIASTDPFVYKSLLNSLMSSAVDITFCLILYRRVQPRIAA